MNILEGFYEQLIDNLDPDELRTIFIAARQKANTYLTLPVFDGIPPEERRILALSLGVSLEVLRRCQAQESE